MRKVLIAGLAALTTLTSGCGGGNQIKTEHPASAASAGPGAAAPSRASGPSDQDAPSSPTDDHYIEVLAINNITGDRSLLINRGHLICTKIQSGKVTYDQLVSWLISDSGFNMRSTQLMLNAAVPSYCPEQQSWLLEQSGLGAFSHQ